MYSCSAMTFCSLTNETKRTEKPRSPPHCDQFPILQASLIINNLSIIKAKTTTLKRVRVGVEGQKGATMSHG